jgi:hypothetical protein
MQEGGNRFGSRGNVSATAKTALPDQDVPQGLTALFPFMAFDNLNGE